MSDNENAKITTTSLNRDRFINRIAFEKYLLKNGYKSEISGAYRSECGHNLVSLIDMQKALNWLAEFEVRSDTESLFKEIMDGD